MANCTEVRTAGRAPIGQCEPGFQAKFTELAVISNNSLK
ncbi:excalibur calcium-binding domain-containing protein [Priestia megaterium]